MEGRETVIPGGEGGQSQQIDIDTDTEGEQSSQVQQYQLDGSSTTIRTENWNSDKNIRNRREFCTVRVMSTLENSCFHRNHRRYINKKDSKKM